MALSTSISVLCESNLNSVWVNYISCLSPYSFPLYCNCYGGRNFFSLQYKRFLILVPGWLSQFNVQLLVSWSQGCDIEPHLKVSLSLCSSPPPLHPHSLSLSFSLSFSEISIYIFLKLKKIVPSKLSYCKINICFDVLSYGLQHMNRFM